MKFERLLGGATCTDASEHLPDARRLTATEVGDGLAWSVAIGELHATRWLWFDALLDGDAWVVFRMDLVEGGADGGRFRLRHALLPHAEARVRLRLSATDQNRWMLDREGAFLKPLCTGDAVDPASVQRIEIRIEAKAPGAVTWEMGPLHLDDAEPAKLDDPALPRGPLIDALGQATWRRWPGRSRDEAEVVARLGEQRAAAGAGAWPDGWSRWGGWTGRRFDAGGWFRTQHEDGRWWLVDPDGCAFWSSGCDCVRASVGATTTGLDKALAWRPGDHAGFEQAGDDGQADFLKANLIRAFGEDWPQAWASVALDTLRRVGFNTVGNWSDHGVAAAAGFPYVRPLALRWPRTPMVFRDFPDVFDPALEQDAADFAGQLLATRDDAAMIGYFLMNEPTWGFAAQTPAHGMLLNTPRCRTREALADHMRSKYGGSEAWARAWGVKATLDDLADGPWRQPLGAAARDDLAAFSTVMVRRQFDALSSACQRVDPHHLNLGARYYTAPPPWALAGMTSFDVFSINGYGRTIRHEAVDTIARQVDRPVMIGEWHFGALDAGLPASGIGHVATQADRGRAYRFYLEDAAANPNCVGVHWFTLYDQSALGRFDGEAYNIGFLDICHRLYEPLAAAARASHERMHEVHAGAVEPFDDAPEHLPMLFC